MPATDTTIAADEIAVHEITLSASTVDTVTFSKDIDSVEVISDGAADLYVRTDGVPVVKDAKGYRLPAGAPSVRTFPVNTTGASVVKLISSGTPKYSVSEVVA